MQISDSFAHLPCMLWLESLAMILLAFLWMKYVNVIRIIRIWFIDNIWIHQWNLFDFSEMNAQKAIVIRVFVALNLGISFLLRPVNINEHLSVSNIFFLQRICH